VTHDADPRQSHVLVVLPTYNEAENLKTIVGRVRHALPDADILVIDDGSPDGTGDIADRLAIGDPAIHTLRRPSKSGLGVAYLAGFDWALRRDYDVIVEMDADGSHPAETLPAMIDAIDRPGVGLVIGSRWVHGGRAINWPLARRLLSRAANLYTRVALGIRVMDATAGFRAYRTSTLRKIDLAAVDSSGYCFQIDLTLRTVSAGVTVVELPIEFRERQLGESKMTGNIVTEALGKVTAWGIGRRASQLRHLFSGGVV
jgi:dolichol-phosphate mannosyltransferase